MVNPNFSPKKKNYYSDTIKGILNRHPVEMTKIILVIFWVLGGILVIFGFWVFWSFSKILENFDHFHFSGILVILVIGWVGIYPL